jgi:hypothetical protein
VEELTIVHGTIPGLTLPTTEYWAVFPLDWYWVKRPVTWRRQSADGVHAPERVMVSVMTLWANPEVLEALRT